VISLLIVTNNFYSTDSRFEGVAPGVLIVFNRNWLIFECPFPKLTQRIIEINSQCIFLQSVVWELLTNRRLSVICSGGITRGDDIGWEGLTFAKIQQITSAGSLSPLIRHWFYVTEQRWSDSSST
jgi:hypothetical protein